MLHLNLLWRDLSSVRIWVVVFWSLVVVVVVDVVVGFERRVISWSKRSVQWKLFIEVIISRSRARLVDLCSDGLRRYVGREWSVVRRWWVEVQRIVWTCWRDWRASESIL